MRSFSVVPQQPRDQYAIELIGADQQFLMVINEFFLNRAIKSFHVSIHLGSFGISMPMVFMQAADFLIEVLHELRAIVGEHRLKRIGKDLGDAPKELSGSQRSMALSGPGKAESRVVIGKRDDVAAKASEKILHRVKGAALSRSAGLIA